MTQSNFKFAITGGIGSGKSTVADIIKSQGLPVYSCDEIYSELLCDGEFLKKLSAEFEGVLLPDGNLNRGKLSELVFNDKAALNKLNSLTHPAIMKELLRKCSGHKIAFAEVPLLFENGFESLFDCVIVVLRNEEDRINAIIERDKISQKSANLRIKTQFNYRNCDFAKYYVIHNYGSLEDLTQKTFKIVQDIKIKYRFNYE